MLKQILQVVEVAAKVIGLGEVVVGWFRSDPAPDPAVAESARQGTASGAEAHRASRQKFELHSTEEKDGD